TRISRMRTRITDPMHMVCDRFDVIVNIWIEMLPGLSNVPSTLNHMVQMRNDTCGNESMPVLIKVQPPGIAGPPGKNLKLMRHRMKPPDAGIEGNPICFVRPWFANERVGKHPLNPVQPAIRAPD